MNGPTLLLACSFLLIVETAAECRECKPFKGGEDFQNCVTNDNAIITRSGKTVRVTLTVDASDITIEWLTMRRRVYNGKLCGPTITVRPADKLYITLINRLEDNQPAGVHNKFRQPNTTNIHLHGLHISSATPGDNVFTRVDPASDPEQYAYDIDPEQPSGTYWYHAHWHGSTMFQVMSGLSGLLIVEDDPSRLDAQLDLVSCPGHCENDVHILLQSTMQFTGGASLTDLQLNMGDHVRLPEDTDEWLSKSSQGIDYFTVNGLLRPGLSIHKNQLKRFRIVNAGGYVGLELEIVKTGTDDHACNIKEIAFDGVYLNAPRDQIAKQSYLAVGGRVDWLIYCDEIGIYELRSRSLEINRHSIGEFRRYNGSFMTINVTQNTRPTPTFPSTLPDRPEFISDLRNVVVPKENKFTVEFADDFYINREKFVAEEDYKYIMEVDTIQEWTFLNTLGEAPHPIHIHVNHFQVISYNDYNGPWSNKSQCYCDNFPTHVLHAQNGSLCDDAYGTPTLKNYDNYTAVDVEQGYKEQRQRWEALEAGKAGVLGAVGYAKGGDWRDVLNLPPSSNITVRFKADKYIGTVVIHCHVLLHEDQGMMITVKVVGKGDHTQVETRDLGCPTAALPETECNTELGVGVDIGIGFAIGFPIEGIVVILIIKDIFCSQ